MNLVEAPLAGSVIDGTEPHGARVTLAVQLEPREVITDLFRVERSYVYASTGGLAVYARHIDGDAGCVALLAEGETRIDVSARSGRAGRPGQAEVLAAAARWPPLVWPDTRRTGVGRDCRQLRAYGAAPA
jgi:hypothetical protein